MVHDIFHEVGQIQENNSSTAKIWGVGIVNKPNGKNSEKVYDIGRRCINPR